MDEMTERFRVLTFNGPLEAGIRAVAVLAAAFPAAYDIQRMTAFDYLLVRTHLLGGPDDLHPAAMIQSPATEVRHKVVLDSLHLMMTRDLVDRVVEEDGIRYRAGESAAMVLDSLRTPYIERLKERANWLVGHLADYDDEAFHTLMRDLFDAWVVEFQHIESSLGAES